MPNYNTAEYNVIYIFSINDERHRGLLKIGKASLRSQLSVSQLTDNCPSLQMASRQRINQETRTALVPYELVHCELAVKQIRMKDGSNQFASFGDTDVHDVLYASHFESKRFEESGRRSEWFKVSKEDAIKAIKAYKNGQAQINSVLSAREAPDKPEIHLREEQEDCVTKTIGWFNSYESVLWDCKMRFGKTVTAYELIRRMNLEGKFKKVIVITHRPAVEDGWDSDHDLIFHGRVTHDFIDKSNGRIEDDGAIDAENDIKLKRLEESGKPFVYFASIQDLRGSRRVKDNGINKNNAVFDMDWDLLIIDEAHEGTKTELGDNVVTALKKKNTKILQLSGTPYNLLGEFDKNVYTWTYVDEQKAKQAWTENHPGEKNPYEELPTMNIFTFDLTDQLENSYRYATEEAAFNFREFFRVWKGNVEEDFREIPQGKSVGDFVHEDDIYQFLSLISEDREDSNYPFSTDEFRDMFRHTFWLVPGVKEAKALSAMLQRHPRFKNVYKVINIAGDGDDEQPYDEALNLVRSAIASYDHTITISCGKLTTGVTVREWTAIMLLSGSASTAASGYMQAIFRVQSPGCIYGKQKKNCYVFDFAPDRTLKVIADVHGLSSKGIAGDESSKIALGEFLNFCPVIAIDGTEMRTYDVPELMRQIKRISVENAINSGFDDDTVYKTHILQNMTEKDQSVLKRLSNVVVPQKKGKKNNTVVINNIGLTDEQRKKAEAACRKSKKQRTPEEEALAEKLKQEHEEEKKLYDLLRAVSIRLPLLFYGADADITRAIHLADFAEMVDNESWKEFLPNGLGKDLFKDILKYYDEDVVVGAGLRIRRMAKAADDLPPALRAKRIVEILSKFKNPDKETVLTPWRIVNLHMGCTYGGYNFFTDEYTKEAEKPYFIDNGETTSRIFCNPNVKILELNSKSGVYPLYLAYSLFSKQIEDETKVSYEEARTTWAKVIKEHIFVLCRTKMAETVTQRTLLGYSDDKANIAHLTKLVEERMKDISRLSKKIQNPATWNMEGEKMKFDAVVGNPPYQLESDGDGTGKDPIYHLFIDLAKSVGETGTLIHPGRFLFNAGKTPKEWNRRITHDKTIKVEKYFPNSVDIFPTVDIKGGIAITYWDNEKDFGEIGEFYLHSVMKSVVEKVKANHFMPLSRVVYPNHSYRFTETLYKENPWAEGRLSKENRYNVTTNAFVAMHEAFYNEQNSEKQQIRIFGRDENLVRTYKWIDSRYIVTPNNYSKFKVFVARANGNGTFGEVLTRPLLGEQDAGHTDTFISIGKFDTREEAENLLKYLATKFLRALLSTLKVTQDNFADKWANIPLLDFTSNSNIDWSQSIDEINKQLYVTYNLTEDEISFIDTHVQEMNLTSESDETID